MGDEPQRRHEGGTEGDLGAAAMARALFSALDGSGIPWCVVGDSAALPWAVRSDIDIVVDPVALPRVGALLDAFARAHGARVVQALRHEAPACWYAIAWLARGGVGFLHPDVCGDWWRGGRRMLSARELLEGRTRHADGFWRPSPPRNALYYLLKRLDKGDLGHGHAQAIAREWNADPREARLLAAAWFPPSRLDTLAAACAAGDFGSIVSRLSSWRGEVEAHAACGPYEFLRERWRRCARALTPTGMLVEVAARIADAPADAFLARWRLAFRRHARWRGRGIDGVAQLATALARSTLLLGEARRDVAEPRLSRGGTRIRLPMALWGTPAADRAMLDLLAQRARKRLGLGREPLPTVRPIAVPAWP
jgi:hypothetical protein